MVLNPMFWRNLIALFEQVCNLVKKKCLIGPTSHKIMLTSNNFVVSL